MVRALAAEMPDTIWDSFPPCAGRVHEVCGPGAHTFAAVSAGLRDGHVLWVIEGWRRERVNPAGLSMFCAPQKVLVAEAGAHLDLLSLSEEALRSGAVSTVVAETCQPLDLTAGRRLQLAAKAGSALGVFIIPEGGGSNAAETRWHCCPQFDSADSTRQRWRLIKNKSGTLNCWTVRWDEQARCIVVVSEAGE